MPKQIKQKFDVVQLSLAHKGLTIRRVPSSHETIAIARAEAQKFKEADLLNFHQQSAQSR